MELTDVRQEPVITGGVLRYSGITGRYYHVPEGVQEIGENAFCHTDAPELLEELYLPDSVQKLHPKAFTDLNQLKKIRLSANLKRLPPDLFAHCLGLQSLTIPAATGHVPRSVLPQEKTAALSWLEVEPGNREYSSRDGMLFSADGRALCLVPVGWSGKVLQVPDGTECIDMLAVTDNPHIRQVVLPKTLTCIGGNAFSGCSNLETVNLEGVTKLCVNAFADCVRLQAVSLAGLDTIPTGAFSGCTRLSSVTLGSRLRRIDGRAFSRCTALESICLPESLRELGVEAFGGAKLTSVTLPKGMGQVGGAAFRGCPLITVYNTIDPDAKAARTPSDPAKHIYPATVRNVGGTGPYVVRVVSAETGEELHRVLTLDDPADRKTQYVLRDAWGRKGSYHFPALDAHFPNIRGIEIQIEHALHRLRYPTALSKKAKKMYITFLAGQGQAVLRRCIEQRDLDTIAECAPYGLIQKEFLPEILGCAADHGAAEIAAFLLEYGNTHFGSQADTGYL